jgi:hypothetical protein
MSNYYAKDDRVQNRQLEVQRLVIPFKITHNASASAVVLATDEPSLLFLKSAGVDQISAVMDGSPAFSAPVDSAGTFNILVEIREQVVKVMQAQVVGRTQALLVNCTLANTNGITAAGDKIVLNCTSGVNASSADTDACLVVEYVCAE